MNDMNFVVAGLIGIAVSIFHGVLMQKHMVVPLGFDSEQRKMSLTAIRLIAPLLHLSTAAWLIGGLCLLSFTYIDSQAVKLTLAAVVALHYAYGAVFNCIATRGRHPGWVLLAVATVFIGLGIYG